MKHPMKAFGWMVLLVIVSMMTLHCSKDDNGGGVPDGDADGDTDSNSSGDGDTDGDADGDGDGDGDTDNMIKDSYIWIANTRESTLSKVDTKKAVEVARYRTCPLSSCDPSRTSVNLYGDVVVTNRRPDTGDSSVTKFASTITDCIDRDDDGKIRTSRGPDDVLPFGQDECMLWNSELEAFDGSRATAWDGSEDPETGKGGRVLIGTCHENEGSPVGDEATNVVYLLNGDTGKIEQQIVITDVLGAPTECLYGGAMDASNGFWLMDGFGFPKNYVRVDIETGEVDAWPALCGYGITVDNYGRVWGGGKWAYGGGSSCVQRFDPASPTRETITQPSLLVNKFLRGIAVGVEFTESFVWAAESEGSIYKIDMNTMKIVDNFHIRDDQDPNDVNGLIGVAIDFEGYVWAVSAEDNACYKLDPRDRSVIKVEIGDYPYTYSDMTGTQLRAAVYID